MSRIWSRIKRRGFTLVELLVVIAIIGMLVSIVMPAISTALFRGKLTQAAANGRNMIQTIIGRETENIYTTSQNAWPKTDETADSNDELNADYFDNSTQYFNWLVTNDVMNVNYNYFAGNGVPSAPDQQEFIDGQGEYCAWCVVGDVTDSTSETTPVLFTRNLRGAEDSVSYTELTMQDFPSDQETFEDMFAKNPFGKKGFVFVMKSGSAIAPFKEDMLVKNFTNLFKVYIDDDDDPLPVLRPGQDY